ncbi:MAG: hypothetical protein HZY77_16240 [Thiobacillus sp.]|uniref:hypothetical protein n=1 Tax=Thiobacillus sp. TaxID=924 RepID=UPI00168C4C1D|nr:hypothetical protein [Thiobacillus sp.]QLQ04085.1 MAG: hypothetical protein HZY77_16240 [Thiobacillus sp.]
MSWPKNDEAPALAGGGASGATVEDGNLKGDFTQNREVKGTVQDEARRLLAKGFKLCEMRPFEKRPKGDGWNLRPIKTIDDNATGYGVVLAANSLGSLDPDDVEPAREGCAAAVSTWRRSWRPACGPAPRAPQWRPLCLQGAARFAMDTLR